MEVCVVDPVKSGGGAVWGVCARAGRGGADPPRSVPPKLTPASLFLFPECVSCCIIFFSKDVAQSIHMPY